jgi:serine/threonine-protein kinase
MGFFRRTLAKGQLQDAITKYREAARLKSNFAGAHYNLGLALSQEGRLDEAIGEYHEAIHLRKDYAEAHCNLAYVLEKQGHFRQAIQEYRLGHTQGTRNPHWQYRDSAKWVQRAEALARFDDCLTNFLAGGASPKDAAEQIGLAQLCQQPYKGLNAAAARFYRDAFTVRPSLADDLDAQHRYNAACAAALAGCCQGKDATRLDESERAQLRHQALTWLRADLKAYRHMLEQAPDKAGQVIAPRLRHWLEDTDFAGVRGSASLARLPEPERKDWQALWQEVEALRRRAEPTPAAANATRR